ncbi:MAG TPA: hypothetical protein PKE06_24165 [Flavilitoribacter sp.]|nr:hypothetical protein [Flavilitoribacter sp.]HMQ86630.1 hypothetical protein [Flavilitoribacter sp.]
MYFDASQATHTCSYYQGCDNQTPYTISAGPIETDDPMDLVEAVLNEFLHSTPEQKAIFKPMLEAWLLETEDREFLHTEEYLLSKRAEEVLQRVYEMF